MERAMVMSVLLLCACQALQPWPVRYLDEGVNRLTEAEIQDKMGSPYETHTLADGSVTWHYHAYQGRPMIGAHGTVAAAGPSACGEYVLRFDHTGVLREWSTKWEATCEQST